MATTEQMEQLLNLLRAVDFPTLLALDRELHHLVAQRGQEVLPKPHGLTAHEEFSQRHPHIAVDPALLTLVGIHPATPVEEDKPLLRESIIQRLAE